MTEAPLMKADKRLAAQRLMAKVKVDVNTLCWNWTAYRLPYGYGRCKLNGKKRLAHRVSFEVFCGPIPEGLFICHRCDNPGCINPDHLFLGTAADNLADMRAKGRAVQVHLFGSSNGRTLISDADVLAIRAAKGISQSDLAERFGISQTQVSRIRLGKSRGNNVGKMG